MSTDGWLDQVLHAPRTEAALPPASESSASLRPAPQVPLPASHNELLRRSNGLRLFDGYFRIFAVGDSPIVWNLSTWNRSDVWKFAWPDHLVTPYLCFGETAFGDQYAYRLDELGTGLGAVYFLDALRMGARKLSDDFESFGHRYLVRNALSPFDSVLLAAHEECGPLERDDHLVHVPPVLLTGDESVERLVRMPAQTAMTLNGDLWTQLSEPPPDAEFGGLQIMKDEAGRDRGRVTWVPVKR